MKLLMIHLMKSLINVLIKPSKNLSLVVMKMYEVEKEKKRLYIERNREEAMNVYGIIISVKRQRVLEIIFDDVFE